MQIVTQIAAALLANCNNKLACLTVAKIYIKTTFNKAIEGIGPQARSQAWACWAQAPNVA